MHQNLNEDKITLVFDKALAMKSDAVSKKGEIIQVYLSSKGKY